MWTEIFVGLTVLVTVVLHLSTFVGRRTRAPRPVTEQDKIESGAVPHICPGCGIETSVYEKEYSKTVCTKCGKRIGWDRETGPYLY